MTPSHWLLKTEPGTYSYSELVKTKTTQWDLVRNFQARNYLRKMAKGDLALIYHSGDERAVVGLARIVKEAYPDPDPDGGDWSQVDIQSLKAMVRSISLTEIKETSALKDMLLIKQSRLSVMPVSAPHFETLLRLGGISV